MKNKKYSERYIRARNKGQFIKKKHFMQRLSSQKVSVPAEVSKDFVDENELFTSENLYYNHES